MILAQDLPNTYEDSYRNKQFNTSALTVWADDSCFYLEPNYSKSLIPTVLKIERKTNQISEIKSSEFVPPKGVSPLFFSFFVGIINLNGKRIIMLSQEVLLVCTINRRDIFKITKPIFLFYNPQDKKRLTDDESKILLSLVIIFQQGMYYSYAYNLTEPLHHIKKLEKTMISGSFNWAQSFQTELAHCDSMWSLPVIQGFVNKIELYINAQKLRIILISRRSLKQGGPWQYTTGLSDKANAANFVQTEQIFSVNDFLFSFVQVRGSVPVYWTQKFSYGMPSNVTFEKTPQDNFKAFQLHITTMLRNRQYQNVVLLNLLSRESAFQKKLIQNYQYLVRRTEKQKRIALAPEKAQNGRQSVGLHYYFFDLHNQCQNKNYTNLNQFISQQLERVLMACGFTAVCIKQDKSYEVLSIQRGIIRANCGTCIDRTNITQSRIAASQLIYILSHSNINIKSFDRKLKFVDGNQAFATLYRNLWADNGDNISQQYTGTGSTESYAIRKGKLSYLTTIDHGLTSLVRAVRNIRQEDEEKNKAVLFLLKGFKSREERIETQRKVKAKLSMKSAENAEKTQKEQRQQKIYLTEDLFEETPVNVQSNQKPKGLQQAQVDLL